MADIINTNTPDTPQSGASLIKGTVSGRKDQFIRQSSDSTASLTLGAGSSGSIVVTGLIHNPNLDSSLFDDNNLIQPEDIIVWLEADFYIDNDNDDNYRWDWGASLSNDQLGVYISFVPQLTPETGFSSQGTYRIKNFGASSHTIYLHVRGRYIVLSDVEL